MGCRELDIYDHFRLTPTTASEPGSISGSPGTRKTAYSRFKPVVSVSISNYRYYSPELGRWLKRDPINELGHILLKMNGEENPYSREEENPYKHTNNNPLFYIDTNGESIIVLIALIIVIPIIITSHEPLPVPEDPEGVFWAPADCPEGLITGFIQVGQGGWGNYNEPFVDDGSYGFGESPTGNALYPTNPGTPGIFSDNPQMQDLLSLKSVEYAFALMEQWFRLGHVSNGKREIMVL